MEKYIYYVISTCTYSDGTSYKGTILNGKLIISDLGLMVLKKQANGSMRWVGASRQMGGSWHWEDYASHITIAAAFTVSFVYAGM